MDYGPAIQYLKWPTYYALSDTKFTFPGTNTVLHDFDNQYKGTMTMRTALVESRNVPAVRTLQAVGISRATKFLKGLGISQKSAYTLANGIGLYVSPLQIAASYAAFANGGTYYKPYYITSITTQDGNTINYNKSGKTAMNKATAYMITDMLKGVINSSDGSGTAAKLSGVNQAGKTGTTSAYSAATGTTSNTNSGSWTLGWLVTPRTTQLRFGLVLTTPRPRFPPRTPRRLSTSTGTSCSTWTPKTTPAIGRCQARSKPFKLTGSGSW